MLKELCKSGEQKRLLHWIKQSQTKTRNDSENLTLKDEEGKKDKVKEKKECQGDNQNAKRDEVADYRVDGEKQG